MSNLGTAQAPNWAILLISREFGLYPDVVSRFMRDLFRGHGVELLINEMPCACVDSIQVQPGREEPRSWKPCQGVCRASSWCVNSFKPNTATRPQPNAVFL